MWSAASGLLREKPPRPLLFFGVPTLHQVVLHASIRSAACAGQSGIRYHRVQSRHDAAVSSRNLTQRHTLGLCTTATFCSASFIPAYGVAFSLSLTKNPPLFGAHLQLLLHLLFETFHCLIIRHCCEESPIEVLLFACNNHNTQVECNKHNSL